MAARTDPLSVVFCWAEVSGYMPACWRALARQGVRVHVLHPQQLEGTPKNPFELESLLAGVSNDMFQRDRPDLDRWLVDTVAQHQPDVVVLCGWIFWPYTTLAAAPALSGASFVLGMDSPWRGTLTQRLGRFRLSALIKRTSAVITAGERSAEYARRLGVGRERIHDGFYGFDQEPLAPVADRRDAAGSWPRRFLFVGRYAAEKGLPVLAAAYQEYRRLVSNPWGLTCCGTGPEARALDGVDGIINEGFVQPAGLPEVFARHGAFVMPSTFEPWGVVIAEAAASGLPIVATSACGASADVVRSYYNGIVVAPGDVKGLAYALKWIHEHEDQLPAMGRRGRALADAFSAESWALKWRQYLLRAVGPGRQ